jgi:ABC-type long-subunit fatty acid transport system fused permease/ATPase subunit
MSTGTIFYFAVGVFTLMVIGIVLTGLEFRKMNSDEAARKRKNPR